MNSETPSQRNRWIAALSTVACLAVMGVVAFAALQERENSSADEVGGAGTVAHDPFEFDPIKGRQPDRPLLAGCGSPDPAKPPRIKFELLGRKFDFGRVKQDVRRVEEVSFRNTGTGTLCVMRVDTTCGCLKVELSDPQKKKFAPGDEGRLKLTLDTRGRQGSIKKNVSLVTNLIDEPIQSFLVECKIDLGIVVSPQAINFGRLARGTSVKQSVYVKSPKENAAWEVTDVVGTREVRPGERAKYTWTATEKKDPNYRMFELSIEQSGMSNAGPFRDQVIIKTSSAERPEIAITAFSQVVDRLMAVPRRVSVGYVRSGAPTMGRRILVMPGGESVEFDIESVAIEPRAGSKPSANGEGFDATFGHDGKNWWVDVKYDGTTRKPGILEAVLLIRTTEPQTPEVRVPIRATVRG